MDESRGGIIYVLSNEAMPGLVKIGRTSGESVSKRVSDLSRATGVPLPFKVEIAREVHDAVIVERALHVAFGPDRVNPAREFFSIELGRVLALVDSYPGRDLTPQTERAVEQEVEQAEPGSVAAAQRFSRKRRPPQHQRHLRTQLPARRDRLRSSPGRLLGSGGPGGSPKAFCAVRRGPMGRCRPWRPGLGYVAGLPDRGPQPDTPDTPLLGRCLTPYEALSPRCPRSNPWATGRVRRVKTASA